MDDLNFVYASTVDTPEKKQESSTQSGSSSWWGFFDKVKQQSEALIQVYKEDLKEFSRGIAQDTTQVIKSNPVVAPNNLTTQLFSGVSSIFSLGNETSPQKQEPEVVDRAMVKLKQLQHDPNTYCVEPLDSDYATFKKNFNVESKTEIISGLLKDETMRDLYAKLVPESISYAEHWCRYFYKSEKLENEELRRANLLQRALSNNSEEEPTWEDEEPSTEASNPVVDDNKKKELEEYFQKIDESEPQQPEPNPAAVPNTAEGWGDEETAPDTKDSEKEHTHLHSTPTIPLSPTTSQPTSSPTPTSPLSTTKPEKKNEEEDWDNWE